jgi:beta-N-acetylhexosaminidase
MRARLLTTLAVVATVSCSAGHRAALPPPTTVATTTSTTTTTAVPCPAWTPAEKAAQLVVVPVLAGDVSGATVASGVGGLLLLGNPPNDLAARLRAADARAPRVRLLVMADEEGGGVQRLAPYVPALPWARSMAANMTADRIRALAASTGQSMRRLGVDADLAPVLDVDGGDGPNERDPDGQRSFGATAATVTATAVPFMRGLGEGGVLAVVKHFPGLGGATGNTDNGPAQTEPIAALRNQALAPFAAAIAAGAPAVMVANAAVPGLTAMPASVSSAVITGLLRHELGFTGLVVTDSLSAGAIRAAGYDVARAAAAAIGAGADMVLFGSTLTAADRAALAPAAVAAASTAIIKAIVAGVAPARLDDAWSHVLRAKGVRPCGGG